MNSEILTIFIGGFLPTWLALASIYYKLGKLEVEIQHVRKLGKRRRRV